VRHTPLPDLPDQHAAQPPAAATTQPTTLPTGAGDGPTGRRLVLRPGVHVLRRSASELQVGLDPRRAVVLPDLPEVQGLLRSLTSPATPPQAYDGRTLEALADSGLLMDADVLLPIIPSPGRETGQEPSRDPRGDQSRSRGRGPGSDHPLTRSSVAALAADCGDQAAALLARRADAHVDVLTCGAPEAVPVAARVLALLTGAGVSSRLLPHAGPHAGSDGVSRRSPAPGSRRDPDRRAGGRAATRSEAGPVSASPGDPTPVVPPEATVLGLVVAVGEPDRGLTDAWIREGVPHLLLRLTEGHAVLGPFVVPGQTACLRCVDAHHTDADPAWPLLVTQYVSAAARTREDAVPEPVDELLSGLAAAWAARELVSRAEDRAPVTLSVTVRLDPLLTALESQRWPRHPACGCTWG
jgi:hypothetical protein